MLNDRWRALRALILGALPEVWALVVMVRPGGGAMSSGVMVVDASFEMLDLVGLDAWDDLPEEAVGLLGPGVFGLSRSEAFRVAAVKPGFATGR